MRFLTLSELKLELKDAGLPEQWASEIIKRHGTSDKKAIDWAEAKRIIKILSKAESYTKTYEPESLLDNIVFMPDELIMYVDNRFSHLKEKYKPYGLKAPFATWEEARTWLIKESLEGVLTTPRIKTMYGDKEIWKADRDLYVASRLNLPYERLEGGVNNLMCNSSPFLLELREIIDSLNNQTGIDKIDLLRYFICDIKLELPKTYLASYKFLHQFFKFQINTTDLTRKEWLEIYDLYRRASERKYKKQLSEQMKSFAKFLETMEVPEKPNAKFYKMLMHK